MASLASSSSSSWTTSLNVNSSVLLNDTLGIATTNDTVSTACQVALHSWISQHSSSSSSSSSSSGSGSNSKLAIALEASSHPSGLLALQGQPWVYAGGGLGNEGECLALQDSQTCLAGAATKRAATLSFARWCWPANCTAHDLVASNVVDVLLQQPQQSSQQSSQQQQQQLQTAYAQQLLEILRINRFLQTGWTCGYYQVPWNPYTGGPVLGILMLLGVLLFWASSLKQSNHHHHHHGSKRTTTTTKNYLKKQQQQQQQQTAALVVTTSSKFFYPTSSSATTGGGGGEVATSMTTTTTITPTTSSASSSCATLPRDDYLLYDNDSSNSSSTTTPHPDDEDDHPTPVTQSLLLEDNDDNHDDDDDDDDDNHENDDDDDDDDDTENDNHHHHEYDNDDDDNNTEFHWLDAFSVQRNYAKLWHRPCTQTAPLDGLRVLSLLWIVLGHVMAIVSSTGPGYSNPVDFLPPTGWTTTWTGQLLFSSRLAVDTFLCLSGFLLVYVWENRHQQERQYQQQERQTTSWCWCWSTSTTVPQVVLSRLIRLWPLYLMTLAVYTQLAPHWNDGPFWHQWQGLLEPCSQHHKWIANVLFVNNVWFPNTAVADTCFYHSWYLAVDVQLFLVGTILLACCGRDRPDRRDRHQQQQQVVLAVLMAISVVATVYGTWTRHWSINTFDGAAVARYDVEAYAQPVIRAQAYFVGMFVGFQFVQQQQRQEEEEEDNSSTMLQHQHSPNRRRHVLLLSIWRMTMMLCALVVMAWVTFVTATGAYAQRPCQYQEWPGPGQCGSTWSANMTFFYTASSRTLWVVSVGVVMYVCMIQPENNVVAQILAWPGWLPLSHLSYGVYLIHPIVIFVWQLGGRDKTVFRLVTFGMSYVSVCVMSYVAALVAALLVELPCATLWKEYVVKRRRRQKRQRSVEDVTTGTFTSQQTSSSSSLHPLYTSETSVVGYGSTAV